MGDKPNPEPRNHVSGFEHRGPRARARAIGRQETGPRSSTSIGRRSERPRSALLERLAREAPEYAWAWSATGAGCADSYSVVTGHVREHLGPLVTDDQESARVLLEASLGSHPNQDFFIVVPDAQRAWTDTLAGAGFAIERPFMRMHRGRLNRTRGPVRIFAITGPEFG
jgi:hypothetical protein